MWKEILPPPSSKLKTDQRSWDFVTTTKTKFPDIAIKTFTDIVILKSVSFTLFHNVIDNDRDINKRATEIICIWNKINVSLIPPSKRFFFLIWYGGGGVQLDPLGTAATNTPIMPVPGDYDDGEIGGMMIGRGNRSARRKPAPVPLCPPQNRHAAWTRTRTAAVGSQQVTAWATARSLNGLFVRLYRRACHEYSHCFLLLSTY
jgi:hypothetical protein